MASKQKAPRRARGYTWLGTYHGIESYILPKNGLRVLYHHDDSAPVAGLMVTYLVGSRHEAIGTTGYTHILEHMMFRGSKKFPSRRGTNVLDQLTAKGALVNASTWLDRTNYFEVLPSEHFELVVALEADRMRNLILNDKELASELPAVRSEYAMYENDANETLDKHMWATAYHAHPYHHSTIGWLADIEHATAARLQAFHDAYYWPNNAVVTVIGDVERDTALTLIAKYFGVHTASPHDIPEPYTAEPEQLGKRFVEVRRSGTKNLVGVAHKVPAGLHPDTPTVLTLATILAGGTTSRLHKALVEPGLAAEVHSPYMPFHDASLMQMYATLVPGIAHEKVEARIHAEIARIITKGVTKDELARVVVQLQTEMALARDGHYATLSALNEALAVGDWQFFFDLPKQVAKVTPQDIKRVAATYCVDDQMTVGYYHGLDK